MQRSALRFSVFRILLGLYLTVGFLSLLPFVNEIYSPTGNFPADHLPRNTLLPLHSWLGFSAEFYFGLLCSSAVLSVLFAVGFYRRWVAAALFLCLWIFIQRNPIADSPELFFLHWLLVGTIFIPEGEPWSWRGGLSGKSDFNVPKSLERAAWGILACGYCFASVRKLVDGDPSWQSGDALRLLFSDSSSRRLWFAAVVPVVPNSFWMVATYSLLALQLSGPLCILNRISRIAWWWLIFAAESFSLLFLDLGPIVIGMLIAQLFVWNPFLNFFTNRKSQP